MASFIDYYAVLGITSSASPEAIKSAYRKLAREYHPDLNAGDASAGEKFKLMNEAYAVLSDPLKRQTFHQVYQTWKASTQVQGGRRQEKAKQKQTQKTKKTNEKDDSTNPNNQASKKDTQAKKEEKPIASGLGDIFSAFIPKPDAASSKRNTADNNSKSYNEKKQKKAQHTKPSSEKNITTTLTLAPEEAETGIVKTVSIDCIAACSRCSGTGRVNGISCKVCQGAKTTTNTKKLDVRIPAGVKNGSKVRVSGEGEYSSETGVSGDLFLVIQIKNKSLFTIEGLDTFSWVLLPVPIAVVGGEVFVLTAQGKVTMTVPAGTGSEKKFRLKGYGLQQGLKKGDHYVTVHLDSTAELSEKEKKLYGELYKLLPNKDKPLPPLS
ncbi:MAG: DnaJ C-terminal domain-containing protein [Cyanobacteria bacterium P01_H01_bin.74]